MVFSFLENLLRLQPKVNLGIYPTPLQRLINSELKLGKNHLYIKRDDLNGIGVGGNKLRNLEYLLGDALQKRADLIIVSGEMQSNLCHLTVASCRRLNLDCIVVHNNERPKASKGNVLLNDLLHADRHFIGPFTIEERNDYIEDLRRKLLQGGRNPYVIHNGASTGVGALGYVEAALELAVEVKKRSLPIKNVCIPAGNGGLAAGFIYGAGFLNSIFHVDVITVEYPKDELIIRLMDLIKSIEEITGISFPFQLNKVITIHDAYRGGGWGKTEERVINFIEEFAMLEGIFVEKVYTSKTLYGMFDLAKKSYFRDGACYLHSGGLGALFSQY